MLFKEELALKIVLEVKTQTRRPIKAGEELVGKFGIKTVLSNGRIKWQVGREYSVQYGRGLPTRLWNQGHQYLLPYHMYPEREFDAMNDDGRHWIGDEDFYPLKIRILDILFEDVRNISEDDAIAEGFEHAENTARWGFLETWASFYDKPFFKLLQSSEMLRQYEIDARPYNLYQAWVLKFEMVKP